MNKRSLVLILLLASAFSSHAMAGDLHDAAATGDVIWAQELIGYGDNPNEQDDALCWTPLHYAIIDGYIENKTTSIKIIKTLLAHPRINPNIKDKAGLTPLHHTAIYCYTKAVKILLQHRRINLNIKDKEGRVALQWAIGNGHRKTAIILCGIDEKALKQIEDDSKDNLERLFVRGNDLLLSYDLETLRDVHRLNEEKKIDPYFDPDGADKKAKLEKILSAAIDYKKNIAAEEEEEEKERLSFVIALRSAEDSPLPTWTRVAVGGTTAVGGATRISMPSCFLNFAQAGTAAGPAYATGTADSTDRDDEEEGEIVDGDQ